MFYLKKFNTIDEYEDFKRSADYIEPNICGIEEGNLVFLTPYEPDHLAFEALEPCTFSFTRNTVQYSVDGTNWNDLAASTSTPTVSAGSKIYFKATNPSISSSYGIGTFSSTGKFNVSGNIMSMLYGDDFIGQTNLTGKNYPFSCLFKNCTRLVDASELILPATTLANACYEYMFQNCTSLTTAPELPATTLANYCYSYMFQGCTSLTTAPALPATTLANYCYKDMLSGCASLTSAPALPATTLARYCYEYMFHSCSKLNNITMLATDISATGCLNYWVGGVASTGTFVKHSNMNSLPTGASGIPSGWTVVDNEEMQYLTFEAIEDGAFSFTQNAIQYSMDGTTWNDLTAGSSTPTVNAGSKIHFKATNPSITTSYGIGTFSSTGRFNVSGNIMSMLYGDDFIGQTNLTGKNYAFNCLFLACSKLVDASNLVLPATTLSQGCYSNMFGSCSSLTTAPELPATTLADSCYASMFSMCSSLTTAPELPASTLASYCYYSMFRYCSMLNNITMLATDKSASYCLYMWVRGVASTGIFYRNPEMTSLPNGIDGIPEGWTVVDRQ